MTVAVPDQPSGASPRFRIVATVTRHVVAVVRSSLECDDWSTLWISESERPWESLLLSGHSQDSKVQSFDESQHSKMLQTTTPICLVSNGGWFLWGPEKTPFASVKRQKRGVPEALLRCQLLPHFALPGTEEANHARAHLVAVI